MGKGSPLLDNIKKKKKKIKNKIRINKIKLERIQNWERLGFTYSSK